MVKHILIVDDNQAFLDSNKDIMEYAGYDVITATNGREAMDFFSEYPFELVIMDFNMPGINGLQCFIKMKKLNSNIKTIIVTAYCSEGLKRQAELLWVYRIMSKPIDYCQLFRLIHEED